MMYLEKALAYGKKGNKKIKKENALKNNENKYRERLGECKGWINQVKKRWNI